jgi:DNA-3-methyladenine glycosylase II
MQYFSYSQTETDHLSRRDDKMAGLITEYGMLQRPVIPDLFEALVVSILSQQVSSKAAVTIRQRLADCCGEITPHKIEGTDQRKIQQCGMTMKKAGYLKAAAHAVLSGALSLQDLEALDDDTVIGKLIMLPGIGRWTAEMLLLHSLQRPNVFSYDDLVIRKSLIFLHHLSAFGRAEFEYFKNLYAPYCSIAMIYLWKYGGSMRQE